MTSEYISYGVNLSEYQLIKLNNAVENNCATSIRLTKNNLHGNHKLPLTQTQINKIKKAKNGVDLKLSASQLQAIKTGGFLPLIPIIAGLIAAAGGVTGGIASAVNSSKQTSEQARHNREMEQQNKAALDQLKSGSGIVSDTVSKLPIVGSFLGPVLKKIGLGLKDSNEINHGGCICKNGLVMKKIGKGLYLEEEGNGLFLGPQGSGLFLDPREK
jgi:hypothetical protein